MPLKRDPSGRRSVQVEVEVPGTPEEVWRAIATGPGIASWFVPTTVEEDEHGKPIRLVANFGPGMESVSTFTSWNPPHHFSAESADLGPGAPPVATEWTVQARAGGTCIVRVVHSLFASTDDWDNQLEGWESGWPGFFRILRLYLTHFRDQACAPVQLQAMSSMPRSEAWSRLCEPLGLAGVVAGDHRQAGAGAPPLGARVERVGEGAFSEEVLLRLDQPQPGIAHLFAMTMGELTLLSLRLYLFGKHARRVAGEQEPRWREWLTRLFPAPGAPGSTCGSP